MSDNTGRTTFGEKIGYSVASIGDAVSYAFMGSFGLFFLTTVAGIKPAAAGTIMAIGTIWNAFFTPIMGYISDKFHETKGRRGPLILVSGILLMVFITLSFTNIDMNEHVKPVYYGFMVVLYWTCFTGFFIPYYTLGLNYTTHYEDRTILRLFASFFNCLGGLFATVLPTTAIMFMENLGFSTSKAWSSLALFLGILTAGSIVITVFASKNKDKGKVSAEADFHEPKTKGIPLKEILVEYIDIARVRPVQFLLFASLMALIAQTFASSITIYYLTYNMDISASGISLFMLIKAFFGLSLIPVVGKVAVSIDKRQTLLLFWGIGMAGMIFIRFVDVSFMLNLAIFMVGTSLCMSIYWNMLPSMYYDVCEYDRIILGNDRASAIVSFQGFIEALAGGIGGQILGIILQWAGFNGESAVQTASAMVWIENAALLIPVIFIIISLIAVMKYPITKKYYNDMLAGKAESLERTKVSR